MQTVRPAAVAGSFYPSEPQALRAAVGAHLAQAGAARLDAPCPKMLVVPHAGYAYSGAVAALAYAQLAPHRANIRRVVLLGPVHRVAVRGMAAPGAEHFETPLGQVRIDQAALTQLADLPQLVVADPAHAREHSLEVQLPFLQTLLGNDFTLLPLAVGDAQAAEVDAVLERLWGGEETLIVISSDLSHYLPYGAARERDAATLQRISRFASDLAGDEACGARALNGALRAARRHGLLPRLLGARNSADATGSGHERVVGYAALAFEPPAVPDRASVDEGATQAGLGPSLLATARAAIAGALGLEAPPAPAHPALARPGATFVTLHDAMRGLRGCIGQLEATRPLGVDVQANARAAAFRDPRFAPVTGAEFAALHLEVSLLSPLQPLPVAPTAIESAAGLQPGVDGVLLQWRERRSTFLPQVWQQIADPEAFMQALLRKAGLPRDFWAKDMRLWRYRVDAYEEPMQRPA